MNILGTFSFALLSSEVKGEKTKFLSVRDQGMRSVKALLKQSGKLTYVDVDPLARFLFLPNRFSLGGQRLLRDPGCFSDFLSPFSLSLPSSPDTQTAKMPNTPSPPAEVFPTAPLFFHRCSQPLLLRGILTRPVQALGLSKGEKYCNNSCKEQERFLSGLFSLVLTRFWRIPPHSQSTTSIVNRLTYVRTRRRRRRQHTNYIRKEGQQQQSIILLQLPT